MKTLAQEISCLKKKLNALINMVANTSTGGGGIGSESDPIFNSSPAKNITNSHIDSLNNLPTEFDKYIPVKGTKSSIPIDGDFEIGNKLRLIKDRNKDDDSVIEVIYKNGYSMSVDTSSSKSSLSVFGHAVGISTKDITSGAFTDFSIGHISGISANKAFTNPASLDYIQKQYVDSLISGYYNKEEIRSMLTGVYKPKGTVLDYETLETITNAKEGDVYNLLSTGGNYVWVLDLNNTGEPGWDKLGDTIDLSLYARKDYVNTKLDELTLDKIMAKDNVAGREIIFDGEKKRGQLWYNKSTFSYYFNDNPLIGTGTLNVGIGYNSLNKQTTGGSNVAIGSYALAALTTGANNIAMGYGAGYNITTANSNVMLGTQAGMTTTSGFKNIFIGDGAGYHNATGNINTIIGYKAGLGGNLGDRNTFIGTGAGQGTVGNNNVLIGVGAGMNDNISNKLIIHSNSTLKNYSNTSEGNFGSFQQSQLSRALIAGDFDERWVAIRGTFETASNVNGKSTSFKVGETISKTIETSSTKVTSELSDTYDTTTITDKTTNSLSSYKLGNGYKGEIVENKPYKQTTEILPTKREYTFTNDDNISENGYITMTYDGIKLDRYQEPKSDSHFIQKGYLSYVVSKTILIPDKTKSYVRFYKTGLGFVINILLDYVDYPEGIPSNTVIFRMKNFPELSDFIISNGAVYSDVFNFDLACFKRYSHETLNSKAIKITYTANYLCVNNTIESFVDNSTYIGNVFIPFTLLKN